MGVWISGDIWIMRVDSGIVLCFGALELDGAKLSQIFSKKFEYPLRRSTPEKTLNINGSTGLFKFSPLYPEYWGLHGQKF